MMNGEKDTTMLTASTLPRYNLAESYRWNYDHAPEPVDI